MPQPISSPRQSKADVDRYVDTGLRDFLLSKLKPAIGLEQSYICINVLRIDGYTSKDMFLAFAEEGVKFAPDEVLFPRMYAVAILLE